MRDSDTGSNGFERLNVETDDERAVLDMPARQYEMLEERARSLGTTVEGMLAAAASGGEHEHGGMWTADLSLEERLEEARSCIDSWLVASQEHHGLTHRDAWMLLGRYMEIQWDRFARYELIGNQQRGYVDENLADVSMSIRVPDGE